jgi:hypothetical protein
MSQILRHPARKAVSDHLTTNSTGNIAGRPHPGQGAGTGVPVPAHSRRRALLLDHRCGGGGANRTRVFRYLASADATRSCIGGGTDQRNDEAGPYTPITTSAVLRDLGASGEVVAATIESVLLGKWPAAGLRSVALSTAPPFRTCCDHVSTDVRISRA